MSDPLPSFVPPSLLERVPVARLADGQELVLPFHRLVGQHDGPTLGLVALLHGDEPPGIEIVRRILAAVDPGELRGSIVAVPVAHAPALAAMSRNSPIDALDLNRNFPGNPDGWLSEQLAHVLSTRLLAEVDMLVDIHSADPFGAVDYVYLVEDARKLALSLGCRHNFVAAHPHPGSLLGVAQARGTPAVILELGGGRAAEDSSVRKGVTAILNLLRAHEMLPGSPRPETPIIFHRLATIRPHAGGLVYPRLGFDGLGTSVVAGELLATVVDPLSFETLEELRSPYEGHLLLVRTGLARIQPGDFAYMVSDLSSEEPREG